MSMHTYSHDALTSAFQSEANSRKNIAFVIHVNIESTSKKDSNTCAN